MSQCPTRAATGDQCERQAGHVGFHRSGDEHGHDGAHYWGSARQGCHHDECIAEALTLLALWYGRWRGEVAGTPEGMATRTARLLERHGFELERVEVQRG